MKDEQQGSSAQGSTNGSVQGAQDPRVQEATQDSTTATHGEDDLLAKVKALQKDDNKIAALQAKIAELEVQLKSHAEMASRAQAELQNVKIRLEREAAEIRKFSSEMTLRKLLPTIDNLQRALKHLPKELESNDWVAGIVALEQAFLKVVSDMGLVRFQSLGQPIDANRHEVLMQGPGDHGKVIEVLEDGYELHGKVIRPAKVKSGDGSSVA